MSIAAFAFKRAVATAVTFITIKALTSEPVSRMGGKLYKKITGHKPAPDPKPVAGRDYDPETGEFYADIPFEGE